MLDNDERVLLDELGRHANVRRVAEELRVPRSTISRRLSLLEEKLGEDLFLRRGRKLLPTRFGELLIERASEARRSLEALDATAAEARSPLERLTIAAAPLFAEIVLPRVLARLRSRRPQLRVELRLSHDRSELFEERIDLALRRGPLADSESLGARKLGRTTFVVVARDLPSWPSRPAERSAAAIIAWVKTLPWIRVGARLAPMDVALRIGPDAVRAVVVPNHAVDSQRIALELARLGVGVARVNLFQVRGELERGTLVEMLPEARTTEDVFAVFPRRRRPSPALRDLLTELVAACRELEMWDQVER